MTTARQPETRKRRLGTPWGDARLVGIVARALYNLGMPPRRLGSFRKGDRAEKLGAFLLQSFCAIAEVPRQEDFGLVDAVATILRRQERFLIAEDSFLVQFKSRSQKTVEFLDGRFQALMAQDLPLFLGLVDLRKKSLELYNLGVALAHPNINDCAGIVAYIRNTTEVGGLRGDILHVVLSKPVLRITGGDTESDEFTSKAYKVLKSWLNLDRWNRRYRRSGIARQVLWETNEVPVSNGTSYMMKPSRAKDALEDIVPYIGLLTGQAMSNAELRAPMLGVIAWLHSQGVELDQGSYWAGFIDHSETGELLKKAMDAHPETDFACAFRLGSASEDHLDFWLVSRNKHGEVQSERHVGSWPQIREKGFVANISLDESPATISLGFSEGWLSSRHLQPASPPQVELESVLSPKLVDIFLLRRALQTEDFTAEQDIRGETGRH